MKKLSTLALVAALAVPFSGVAYGLDATVKAGAAGSAATTGTETSVDATATGSVKSNYGTLISTLNAGKGTVDLSGVSADADVSVVNLSSLKGDADAKALDNALAKSAGTQTTLHASINANAALKAKLDAQGVTVDNVVAVTTGADGMITVYVDDRT